MNNQRNILLIVLTAFLTVFILITGYFLNSQINQNLPTQTLTKSVCLKNKCISLQKQDFEECLPVNISLNDIAEIQNSSKITIKDKLIQAGATCQNNKLLDRSKKEIAFYRLTGCWGNAPADYQEIMDKQKKELEKLRIKYDVIEITCNPSGIPQP